MNFLISYTITRPPEPLCITYPLLPLHSLWPSIPSATMPPATPTGPVARNLGGVEA